MTQDNTIGQIDFDHWLLRLIAFAIDCLIIAIPTAIIAWLLGVASGWFLGLLSPLILGILEVLYFAFLDMSWGATIGKRLLGLKVQTTNGGRVSFDKAFIRNLSKIYWILLLLDWLLGFVTAGNDRHQKYSDRFAGTTVVSVNQPFASSQLPAPPPPPPPTSNP